MTAFLPALGASAHSHPRYEPAPPIDPIASAAAPSPVDRFTTSAAAAFGRGAINPARLSPTAMLASLDVRSEEQLVHMHAQGSCKDAQIVQRTSAQQPHTLLLKELRQLVAAHEPLRGQNSTAHSHTSQIHASRPANSTSHLRRRAEDPVLEHVVGFDRSSTVRFFHARFQNVRTLKLF